MTRAEREKLLTERLEELKSCERACRSKGFRFVAGVDEAGRGPLAGPVVAACAVLPDDFDVLGVDDSKKVSEKRREVLYDKIRERAVCYGIGEVDNRVIDRINILEATRLAMRRAIEEADRRLGGRRGAAIDFVIFDAMHIDQVKKEQLSLIRADSRVLCVAAASIIAKVYRDRLMRGYDRIYPGYGFAANKGYGTPAHYEGLEALGPCPIHRSSFTIGRKGRQ